MLEELTPEVKRVLRGAQEAALAERSGSVTCETIFASLVGVYGAPAGEARAWLEHVREESEPIAAAGVAPALLERPALNPEARHAIATAWRFAILFDRSAPHVSELLLGLLWEKVSTGAQAAALQGIDFEGAFEAFTGIRKPPPGFRPVEAPPDFVAGAPA